MARTLTTASRTALFAQGSSMVLPILLDITHTYGGIASPIRLVNNNVALTYDGNVYTPYAFRFDPPDDTQEGVANAGSIDATDQTIIEVLRSITVAPTVLARAMFYNDAGTVVFEELVPWSFTLKNIVANIHTISGDLIYEDRLTNQMCPIEFTPYLFPGVN